MTSRLTSTHFVGRVGELAELELAVQEASTGRPALVLLGGDSDVGKTRLAGELALAASGRTATAGRRFVPATACSRPTASCRTRRCSARCGRWSTTAIRRWRA